jgi:hypothetical protein
MLLWAYKINVSYVAPWPHLISIVTFNQTIQEFLHHIILIKFRVRIAMYPSAKENM